MYESEGDQKLTRVLSDFRKQQVSSSTHPASIRRLLADDSTACVQDELVERTNDMLEQVDDLYDKLQGTKNGGRRGRGHEQCRRRALARAAAPSQCG